MNGDKKMEIKTDIQIAQECEKEKITEIAKKVDIDEKYLELYGTIKQKSITNF